MLLFFSSIKIRFDSRRTPQRLCRFIHTDEAVFYLLQLKIVLLTLVQKMALSFGI